jgi:hypothetical protein
VITGPNVLIVRFELADPVPLMGNVVCPAGYENVQMGGTVTSGLMVLQESVMPGLPGGVLYPLTGFTLMTPCPPLPAGTEVGVTGLATEIVNCGVTANTVTVSGGKLIVWEVEGAVPVIVIEYAAGAVSILLVIVTEAVVGGVTVAGLTEQTGGSAKSVGDTWQLKSTVPAKPFTDPIVTLAAEVPSGPMATGENEVADKVKLPWAEAAVARIKSAAKRERAATPARMLPRTTLDVESLDGNGVGIDASDIDGSDFNMSKFRFNYLRFSRHPKGCPARV